MWRDIFWNNFGEKCHLNSRLQTHSSSPIQDRHIDAAPILRKTAQKQKSPKLLSLSNTNTRHQMKGNSNYWKAVASVDLCSVVFVWNVLLPKNRPGRERERERERASNSTRPSKLRFSNARLLSQSISGTIWIWGIWTIFPEKLQTWQICKLVLTCSQYKSQSYTSSCIPVFCMLCTPSSIRKQSECVLGRFQGTVILFK